MDDKNVDKPSGTDWQKLEAVTDDEIDYSDIPPLGEDFFTNATLRRSERAQVVVTMHIDPVIFAWFDAQEGGWEQRMRAALQIYVDAYKEQHPIPAG